MVFRQGPIHQAPAAPAQPKRRVALWQSFVPTCGWPVQLNAKQLHAAVQVSCRGCGQLQPRGKLHRQVDIPQRQCQHRLSCSSTDCTASIISNNAPLQGCWHCAYVSNCKGGWGTPYTHTRILRTPCNPDWNTSWCCPCCRCDGPKLAMPHAGQLLLSVCAACRCPC